MVVPLPGSSQLYLPGSIVVSFWSQPKFQHLTIALSELLSEEFRPRLRPTQFLCSCASQHILSGIRTMHRGYNSEQGPSLSLDCCELY